SIKLFRQTSARLCETTGHDHNGVHELSAEIRPAVVAGPFELSGPRGDAVGVRRSVLRGAVVLSAAVGTRGRPERGSSMDADRSKCDAGPARHDSPPGFARSGAAGRSLAQGGE